MEPARVDGLYNYERQAIGLPQYELKEVTENDFAVTGYHCSRSVQAINACQFLPNTRDIFAVPYIP